MWERDIGCMFQFKFRFWLISAVQRSYNLTLAHNDNDQPPMYIGVCLVCSAPNFPFLNDYIIIFFFDFDLIGSTNIVACPNFYCCLTHDQGVLSGIFQLYSSIMCATFYFTILRNILRLLRFPKNIIQETATCQVVKTLFSTKRYF